MHGPSRLQSPQDELNDPPLFDTTSSPDTLVPFPACIDKLLFILVYLILLLPAHMNVVLLRQGLHLAFYCPLGPDITFTKFKYHGARFNFFFQPTEIFVTLILSFTRTLSLPACRNLIRPPPPPTTTLGKSGYSLGSLLSMTNLTSPSPTRRRHRTGLRLGNRPDHSLNPTSSTYLLCKFWQWDFLHFPASEFLFSDMYRQ